MILGGIVLSTVFFTIEFVVKKVKIDILLVNLYGHKEIEQLRSQKPGPNLENDAKSIENVVIEEAMGRTSLPHTAASS